jgi:hypothetical protein
MEEKTRNKLSRTLTYLLRHKASRHGLTLDRFECVCVCVCVCVCMCVSVRVCSHYLTVCIFLSLRNHQCGLVHNGGSSLYPQGRQAHRHQRRLVLGSGQLQEEEVRDQGRGFRGVHQGDSGVRIYIYMYVYVCMCVYVCTSGRLRGEEVCVCVCVCVHVCVDIRAARVWIHYTHTRTHTHTQALQGCHRHQRRPNPTHLTHPLPGVHTLHQVGAATVHSAHGTQQVCMCVCVCVCEHKSVDV